MSLAHQDTAERADFSTAIEKLHNAFGDKLSTGQALRAQHAATATYHPMQLPDAVLFAESRADVQQAVQILAAEKCPIIPFGVGSSLEGHVNAPQGGVSIDVSRMDQILAVHQEDMDVVVQPGVTREQLNQHLRDTGLFFPIDPGANASIGGMTATRASGTNAVRYGTMRDAVLGLEVVLPNGEIIHTGGRARKSSAGYDLTRLMIGSEGTLGLFTEITLRLHGIPEHVAGGHCSFPDVGAACEAVIMTIQCGLPVARIELLDTMQVKACNAYNSDYQLPESPLLLLEFHGSAASVAEQSEMFNELAASVGGGAFQWSADPEERNRLWKVRHDAYWAAKNLINDAEVFATDVCVPVSRLAECVTETQKDIEASGLIAPIVGHVGDGNFHCLALLPPDQPEVMGKLDAFAARLSQRAIDMGGTCTGEHGVGQGKCQYLRQEAGAGVDVMQAIKQQIDPDNLFNPGKIFS